MITKEEFEEAYRKFTPSKFEQHYIKKIFATHNMYKNRWLAAVVCLILIIPIILAIIIQFTNVPHRIFPLIKYTYILMMAYIGINWLIIWFQRIKRYEKIRKYLHLSKEEYAKAIDIFYYNKYADQNDFINKNTK
jgi:magnesium-transporting ATPase (P-type)